jgi:hypothetical protein
VNKPDGSSCGGPGQICSDGTCDCQARTCQGAGWDCGAGDDGCSGTLDCGGCRRNQRCEDHQCVAAPACKPKTCRSEDWECGSGDDGCDGDLDCGDCKRNERCDDHQCVRAR